MKINKILLELTGTEAKLLSKFIRSYLNYENAVGIGSSDHGIAYNFLEKLPSNNDKYIDGKTYEQINIEVFNEFKLNKRESING